MANTHEDDMYLFQSVDPSANGFGAGSDFDTFLENPISPEQDNLQGGFLNPNDLIKQEQDVNSPNDASLRFATSHRGSDSSSSSSEAYNYHNRNNSGISTSSSALAAGQGSWGTGINGYSMPAGGEFLGDTPMEGISEDVEAVNQQMASDFDFETAASTPSGYDPDAASSKKGSAVKPLKRTANFGQFPPTRTISSNLPAAAPPAFFFANSREASPLNAMLPGPQGQSPWNKHSPSSGLEETFNGITMNGDSPGNNTFSPGMQYGGTGFSFDAASSATPSSMAKDATSPPSTVNSIDGTPLPRLTIQPTSHKSRVETQIPIKLMLSHLPSGAKKLRLPTHTVSKPKFLVKGDVDRAPEILELYTSIVCTSAMQDPVRYNRALARARGEHLVPLGRPSPASSTNSDDDEDKPLNGGEVRICAGCIQRERKRASRKKQKKPEEEEVFQRDEEKRIVVFNTNEIKEWVELSREPSGASPQNAPSPNLLPSAMQVELPMRIACYCRHQNEKMGFQVIFTIKDYRDRVVAQEMTNAIMITDDHKTHNAPAPVQHAPQPLPTAPPVPGAGVFQSAGNETGPGPVRMSQMFKTSLSTTDLQNYQSFNPSFNMGNSNNPFAIPTAVSNETSGTMTPRNLSRPASPSGPSGPSTKKRKQSGSGKLPSGLTMTRLETRHSHQPSGSATMPNTAASSPYASDASSFMSMNRPFAIAPSRPNHGTSPPTPNGNEVNYNSNINRSFSLENLSRQGQGMMSAPPSRQPSRPASPVQRGSFGAGDPNFSQAVSSQLMNQTSRRPPPLIHKLVPAEGSVTGGTEVTLLGNGFYQGLEVMFGDTEATTTTYWGEKCLNCIAPPALQPGTVAVVFKHEHPQYASMPPSSQRHPCVFTYTDDRELDLFRLALRTIGKQMHHPTDDPYSAAQQLIQGQQQQTMWPAQGGFGRGGGHQRLAGMDGAPTDMLELENTMVQLLDFIDVKAPTGLLRLDVKRPSGLTMLHLASSLGLTRFVAGLLARGANPNSFDKNGNTPLHHAAMNGHTHIIHRLRIAGASHKVRSLRNFTPADLATSLLAYQAVVIPSSHYRSRSVGGTPMRLQSRRNSSTSIVSSWDTSSAEYNDSSSEASDNDAEEDLDAMDRPHLLQHRSAVRSLPVSRRGSAPHVSLPSADIETGPNGAPSAFMLAWRDHLVNQLYQFNESAQSVMPSLATLNGPLQALQEYQASPMVRRMSSLFPQRPASRQAPAGAREGWWETLTGSVATTPSPPSPPPTAPPAYGDLYPEGASVEDVTMKKQSAMQAAADAAADSHYDAETSTRAAQPPQHRPVGSGPAMVRRQTPQRIELKNDKKLFFIWVSSDDPRA